MEGDMRIAVDRQIRIGEVHNGWVIVYEKDTDILTEVEVFESFGDVLNAVEAYLCPVEE